MKIPPLLLSAGLVTAVLVSPAPASAQAPAAPLPAVDLKVAFEITSVKPNRTLDSARRIGFSTSGLNATNITVNDLLRTAYGAEGFRLPDQIVGGPDWMNTERFDVAGRVDATAAEPFTPARALAMVRSLLAQRFNASVHAEVREQPVYALVSSNRTSPQGPKLKVSTLDCSDFFADRPVSQGMREACQLRVRPGQMLGSATMARLAQSLSPVVERMVIDKTGVGGLFELELTWVPDDAAAQPGAAGPVPSPPVDGVSIFTALQEQLGLRLQAERGPVRVLVIDRIDRSMPD